MPAQTDSESIAPAGSRPRLRVFRPDNPFVALGMAVNHLMTKPAFAKLQFGEWSRILVGQINRKHYLFVVDENNRVQGFLGWALTSKEKAEAWLAGRAALSYEDSIKGDCIVFNALEASGPEVRPVLRQAARQLMVGKEAAYFKRFYDDGSTKPMRLPINKFVAQHLEESTSDIG